VAPARRDDNALDEAAGVQRGAINTASVKHGDDVRAEATGV
jgi:hypothetical protein